MNLSPRRQTTKGYSVSGIARHYNVYKQRADCLHGRVRVVKGNPYFDKGAFWTFGGKAINHEYGDLV